jgi:hypothetical protein
MMNHVLINNGLSPVYLSRDERDMAGPFGISPRKRDMMFTIADRTRPVLADGSLGKYAVKLDKRVGLMPWQVLYSEGRTRPMPRQVPADGTKPGSLDIGSARAAASAAHRYLAAIPAAPSVDAPRQARYPPYSYDAKGQALILYADDLLANAFEEILEDALKDVFSPAGSSGGAISGAKLIIYSKTGPNAAILEDMIKRADPSADTVTITGGDIRANGDEVREASALLRLARARGAKEAFGLIRGPTVEPEYLAAFAKESKLPVVIVGPEKGVYSLRQAIMLAAAAKAGDGAPASGRKGWLMMLPPVRALTEEIRLIYERRRLSLGALQAA